MKEHGSNERVVKVIGVDLAKRSFHGYYHLPIGVGFLFEHVFQLFQNVIIESGFSQIGIWY